MNAIEFENVFKAYDGDQVLADFSMAVGQGQTKILLGGSGSGKSTILKMVPGLIKPDTGKVHVLGEDITDFREKDLMPIRQQIGMVFQEGALFDSQTVGENVAYRLQEEATQSHREIENVVRELLGFVGLEHAMDKMPSELSGGMRRRVAIARAMVGTPRIMLYDEPTAGLDPITSRTICELIIKLRDLEGVSSIFVTTDLNSAMVLAREYASAEQGEEVAIVAEGEKLGSINTEFVILKQGRIIFEGNDEELEASTDAYIQEFLS